MFVFVLLKAHRSMRMFLIYNRVMFIKGDVDMVRARILCWRLEFYQFNMYDMISHIHLHGS